MIKRILIILTIFLAVSAWAGESEFPLFSMGAGGRAIGLGGAYTGAADDATSLFWNPAGMSQIKNNIALTFTNRIHFQDQKFLEAFAIYSDIKYGAFGLGIISNQTSDILAYDANFNYLGKFDAYQRAIMIGYSYNLAPINIGFSITSAQAGLNPPTGKVKGSGLAMTLGLMTRLSGHFKIGSIIRPGFSEKYDNSKDDIPGNARLGLESSFRTGITSPNDSLRFLLDFDQTNKLPLKLNIGLELTFFKMVALRGGINSLYLETRSSKIKTADLNSSDRKFTFGIGLKVPTTNAGLFILDAGLMTNRLGNSTAISIGWAK
jgi:hypothetical protein